ncbi:hypothetical protein [Galliscardovia ingluviei]|nr:hypothetical protein [Galliscardovia ingluviei]
MHVFTPKRCATANKVMYRSQQTAQSEANRLSIERNVDLWIYHCEYCNTWHLTSHLPQTAWTKVPLNQQLKPHSRKRGYKPRRR